MTNREILMQAGQALAEAGRIAFTGREYVYETESGEKMVFRETEDIHTYARWKQKGFQVRKGQKAVAKIKIWKHTTKVNDETGEEEEKMFMKEAAFFSRSQVERLPA